MPMTELERFRATLDHQSPDRLLFYLSFTPDLERRVREHQGLGEDEDLSLHFGAYRPLGASLKRPESAAQPDWSVYFEGEPQPENSYFDRNGCLHVPAGEYHFTHRISPLRNAKSLADIENYPWPDWGSWSTAHFADLVARAHSEGRVARVSCTHMYEEAWQVRGYEQFLMDMIAEPEWSHYILDRFMARNKLIAMAAAKAGADELHTGDDVANQNALMFSKQHWRAFIKEKWAGVYSAAKDINPDIKIWYHSDGNITDIIPELIDIGVDIFNPLQPECVDLVEIKKLYGQRIVIDGAIGTQTTMPFGTPDDVRACVTERVATLGGDGALILSPTHVLEPEVPIPNILAFVEACREAGRERVTSQAGRSPKSLSGSLSGSSSSVSCAGIDKDPDNDPDNDWR
jgi:uroporphyrinogen decarboxylase